MIPASLSWKASFSKSVNNNAIRVGVNTQLRLTPLVTGSILEDSLPHSTLAFMPLQKWWTISMNLAEQPNFDVIHYRPCWLTVSKAFVRSTKVVQGSQFCSWHFSWSYCVAKNKIKMSMLKIHQLPSPSSAGFLKLFAWGVGHCHKQTAIGSHRRKLSARWGLKVGKLPRKDMTCSSSLTLHLPQI